MYKNVKYKCRIIKILKLDFFVFEKLLLGHKFWPRDVQPVENLTMYTPNLQMGSKYVDKIIWVYIP